MSIFQFKNLQRVILPAGAAYGVTGVQGIVISGGTELDGVPRYNVQFLSHLKRSANRDMESCVVTVAEPELLAAQPPKMVAEDAALALAKQAAAAGRAGAFAEINAEREARAAKRKKFAKAKSKSKRKR